MARSIWCGWGKEYSCDRILVRCFDVLLANVRLKQGDVTSLVEFFVFAKSILVFNKTVSKLLMYESTNETFKERTRIRGLEYLLIKWKVTQNNPWIISLFKGNSKNKKVG